MLIHWNFDPILFSIGPLAIRWYGLLFVAAFYGGQMLVSRIFAAEGQPPQQADALLVWALLGTVIGARLVHCLFYAPEFYLSHPLAMLRIWEGGLASHGGAAGMLIGLWLGSRRMQPQRSFLWLLDRVAIASALGAVLVRVANFLNSEIVGLPTDGSWGVVFDVVDALPRHPVQLYEAAAYLLIGLLLLGLYRRHRDRTPPGLLVGCFMALVFAARIAAEFFKTPQASYEAGQAFSVGQWLSLPFVVLGLWLMLSSRGRPPAVAG